MPPVKKKQKRVLQKVSKDFADVVIRASTEILEMITDIASIVSLLANKASRNTFVEYFETIAPEDPAQVFCMLLADGAAACYFSLSMENLLEKVGDVDVKIKAEADEYKKEFNRIFDRSRVVAPNLHKDLIDLQLSLRDNKKNKSMRNFAVKHSLVVTKKEEDSTDSRLFIDCTSPSEKKVKGYRNLHEYLVAYTNLFSLGSLKEIKNLFLTGDEQKWEVASSDQPILQFLAKIKECSQTFKLVDWSKSVNSDRAQLGGRLKKNNLKAKESEGKDVLAANEECGSDHCGDSKEKEYGESDDEMIDSDDSSAVPTAGLLGYVAGDVDTMEATFTQDDEVAKNTEQCAKQGSPLAADDGDDNWDEDFVVPLTATKRKAAAESDKEEWSEKDYNLPTELSSDLGALALTFAQNIALGTQILFRRKQDERKLEDALTKYVEVLATTTCSTLPHSLTLMSWLKDLFLRQRFIETCHRTSSIISITNSSEENASELISRVSDLIEHGLNNKSWSEILVAHRREESCTSPSSQQCQLSFVETKEETHAIHLTTKKLWKFVKEKVIQPQYTEFLKELREHLEKLSARQQSKPSDHVVAISKQSSVASDLKAVYSVWKPSGRQNDDDSWQEMATALFDKLTANTDSKSVIAELEKACATLATEAGDIFVKGATQQTARDIGFLAKNIWLNLHNRMAPSVRAVVMKTSLNTPDDIVAFVVNDLPGVVASTLGEGVRVNDLAKLNYFIKNYKCTLTAQGMIDMARDNKDTFNTVLTHPTSVNSRELNLSYGTRVCSLAGKKLPIDLATATKRKARSSSSNVANKKKQDTTAVPAASASLDVDALLLGTKVETDFYTVLKQEFISKLNAVNPDSTLVAGRIDLGNSNSQQLARPQMAITMYIAGTSLLRFIVKAMLSFLDFRSTQSAVLPLPKGGDLYSEVVTRLMNDNYFKQHSAVYGIRLLNHADRQYTKWCGRHYGKVLGDGLCAYRSDWQVYQRNNGTTTDMIQDEESFAAVVALMKEAYDNKYFPMKQLKPHEDVEGLLSKMEDVFEYIKGNPAAKSVERYYHGYASGWGYITRYLREKNAPTQAEGESPAVVNSKIKGNLYLVEKDGILKLARALNADDNMRIDGKTEDYKYSMMTLKYAMEHDVNYVLMGHHFYPIDLPILSETIFFKSIVDVTLAFVEAIDMQCGPRGLLARLLEAAQTANSNGKCVYNAMTQLMLSIKLEGEKKNKSSGIVVDLSKDDSKMSNGSSVSSAAVTNPAPASEPSFSPSAVAAAGSSVVSSPPASASSEPAFSSSVVATGSRSIVTSPPASASEPAFSSSAGAAGCSSSVGFSPTPALEPACLFPFPPTTVAAFEALKKIVVNKVYSANIIDVESRSNFEIILSESLASWQKTLQPASLGADEADAV